MTKALKELIKNAPTRVVGNYTKIMFVSNGVYDGFWGKNGYDNMLILGFSDDDKKWYKISEYGDVFSIYHIKNALNVDIDSKYKIPAIWFSGAVHIDNSMSLSSVTGELL